MLGFLAIQSCARLAFRLAPNPGLLCKGKSLYYSQTDIANDVLRRLKNILRLPNGFCLRHPLAMVLTHDFGCRANTLRMTNSSLSQRGNLESMRKQYKAVTACANEEATNLVSIAAEHSGPELFTQDPASGVLELERQSKQHGLQRDAEDTTIGSDHTKTSASQALQNSNDFSRLSSRDWQAACLLTACSCKCHERNRISTLGMLDPFFGAAYAGLHGLYTPACTETSCSRQWTKSAWLKYYFPSWFLSRMVSLVVSSSPLCGLSVELNFPRLVDRNAEIFSYAAHGDIDGLVGLFRRREASPKDVQFDTGYTALSVRRIDLFACLK